MSIRDRALNKYIEVKDKEKNLDERSYRIGFIHGCKEQQKPRPIETAPRDFSTILLYDGEGWNSGYIGNDGLADIRHIGNDLTLCNFTHWFPLPDTEGL